MTKKKVGREKGCIPHNKKLITIDDELSICRAYEDGAIIKELKKKFGTSGGRITQILHGHNISTGRGIYSYNLDTFYREDDISYYLLGAFMTDGSVRHPENSYCAEITSKDLDWLELIRDFICPEKPIITGRRGHDCSEILFTSKELVEWLISKGCTPRKSLTLQFPEVPRQYLSDFLRGCWDGDGTLGIHRRKGATTRSAAISSGSIEFCNKLKEVLTELDFKVFISVKESKPRKIEDRIITSTRENYAVVAKNGEEAYKLAKFLYPEGNRIAMPRKLAIAKELVADWEKEFRCQDCGVILVLDKMSRRTLYCYDCGLVRHREVSKLAQRKYRTKDIEKTREINRLRQRKFRAKKKLEKLATQAAKSQS